MVNAIYITIDGKIFTQKFEAEAHEKTLLPKETPAQKYMNKTYNGRHLLAKHNLDETGIWTIFGEDPNCDLSGHHHEPILGTYGGSLRNVLNKAVELPGFWTWGAGGTIKKLEVTEVF